MNFDSVVNEIDKNFVNKNIVLLYAFNAVGKTRLSKRLEEKYEEDEKLKILCYNAFLEDMFNWDNDKCILYIEDFWAKNLIMDEGLDGEIVDYFREIVGNKIEPKIDLNAGSIEFINKSDGTQPIKISKGEETLFKWVFFYVILDNAIEQLSTSPDNRSTPVFNHIQKIIIDDPVSSIDDYRIFNIATSIISLLNKIREDESISLPVLISTHHALFFNILFNQFKKKGSGTKKNKKFVLQNNSGDYLLTEQDEDSVVAYHLNVIKEIERAIHENNVEKYHFNLFRSVLEKTAVFLGCSHYSALFTSENYRDYLKLSKIINENSHNKFVDVESSMIPTEQIEDFVNGFKWFIKTYYPHVA